MSGINSEPSAGYTFIQSASGYVSGHLLGTALRFLVFLNCLQVHSLLLVNGHEELTSAIYSESFVLLTKILNF